MSATPAARSIDAADLLVQVRATARRLAEASVRPRLRTFDSPQSAQAWSEITDELRAQGLLDPPFDPSDSASPHLIAAILREVTAVCPGVAAGLWAHYAARLPIWLSGRVPSGTDLATVGLPEGAKPPSARSFGATVAVRPEVDVRPPLGLRACGFGTAALAPTIGQAPQASSRAIPLAWLAVIAVSNASEAIREAKAYAESRYQGCGLIIDHPVIRRMFGRMEMLNAAAAALAEKTLGAHTDHALAGLAKAFATQTGEQICSDSVQILGGYGYMEDYGLEKRLRDAKTLCVIGGSNASCVESAVRIPA